MVWKLKDLTGQTFGHLTVLKRGERKHPTYWLCECVCGARKEIRASSLAYGQSRSCGCKRGEILRQGIANGGSGTPGYKSWIGLRQRCNNPNDRGFKHYGGRGIRVCAEWDASFEAFWRDMGPTWFPGATIERDDVNGPYAPGNCSWVTRAQQPKNRRTVPVVETPWGPMLIPELARKVGLSPVQMSVRYRKGWRGEKLWSPPTEKGARITPRNHKKTPEDPGDVL